MLQSMRQLAQSWVVKGLMFILMISFSIWGIGDIFRGNPLEKRVAKAGNTDISVQELNHSFEETLTSARQSVDPTLTAQQAKHMGLLDKTLDTLVKRTLVDQDIKRLGIVVSPDAVLAQISDQPQFRNKDGSFNKDLFRQILEQQHLTESGFIAEGQQDLSRQILLTALKGDNNASQTEIDAIYKARAQKRIFDVVTVDASKMSGIASPDDKALHDFYNQNPTLFTAPEYRGLTIAALTTDALSKDITITDDEVKKEYDSKLDQLAKPEERSILQVVVQDQTKANQISEQAHASKDLAATAAQDKETAVPLDDLEQKNLLPELSKIVFSMHVGDVSNPIKTQLGWHVIQIKKISPAGTPSFADIKDELREDMQHDQAVESATRIVNQLDDQLAAGHSLDDIADELKLRLIKIPAVDANGLTPDSKEPTELPNKAAILKDAFSQNSGDTSPVEDDKAGNYYVVRTDDVTPSGVKPFDTVKGMIADAWKIHEQAVKAQTEAQEIGQKLKEGKPTSDFANREGVSVRTSLPISQLGDSDPLLPSSITADAFRIKKGDVATTVDGNKQIIIRLSSLIEADPLKNDPRKNFIAAEIKKSTGDELLAQYIQHLYVIFPVSTNLALLDRLRQQDN